MTASELAWSQNGDQVMASLRDSGGTNPDLYRTAYAYNDLGEQTLKTAMAYDATPDYAGTVNSTAHRIGYWRLDDGSGNALDQSGTYQLTVTAGGVTRSQVGGLLNDPDTAMTMAASGSGRAYTSSLSLSQSAYSLEAWFAVTSAGQTNKGIIGDFSGSGAMINLDQNGFIEIAHSTLRVVSSIVPAVGRWYHVVATWDVTSGNATLYVDGAVVGQGNFGAPGTGASTFELGDWGNGAAGTFVNATIDEAAYYDVALTTNQIGDHFAAGRSVASDAAETFYDGEGHPTQTDDQALSSNGFESGLGTWIGTGSGSLWTTDPASPDRTYIHTGYASYKTSLTGSVNQDVPLVPGQTFRFQVWAKTSGAAQPLITAAYWRLSSHAWVAFPSFPATEPASGSFTSDASDVGLPADSDGRVRITLGVSGGSGSDSVYYDDAALLTSYARSVFDASGRPTDGYTFATGGANAEIRTSLVYGDQSGAGGAANAHPGLWPTAVIANYIDGTQGPGADEDVTSTTTFDGWGRKLSTTDPDGVTTTTAYDPVNLTNVITAADALGNTTTMTYDLVGNVLSTSTPSGRVASSTYDLGNHVLTTTAPDGTVSRNDYNAWGERTASWANHTTGSTGADHDLVTVYAYDLLGQVTQTDVDCAATADVITLPCTGGLDARTTTASDLLGASVTLTVYPLSGGTGTARTTTNAFETFLNPIDGKTYSRTAATGTRLAIAPSAAPAPLCPDSTTVRCNTAATWTWNGTQRSGVDTNGRAFATTDAYGIVTLTENDLAGRSVQVTTNYLAAGGHGTNNDQNIVTATQYDLAGQVIAATDPLGRSDTKTYDALGRVLAVSHNDSTGTSVSGESTSYLYSGRVNTTNDGSSTTKTIYHADGRAIKTIKNVDAGGNAGMTMDAFESGADGWSAASSGFFTTGAAGMATETDPAGNTYSVQAPFSGRGRLHLTTDAVNTLDGTWLNLSGPTYQAGHSYQVAFDLLGASGTALRAFLGQDQSGGSYSELSGGISADGTWHRYVFAWTPAANVTSPVHFAVRKDAAGTANVYLDNVVVWDGTAGWTDKGIVSSETAYNADGQVITSVLPPGDPATERPLVSTVAYDAAGRTVMTVVNDATGGYAATVKATSGIAAYFALDELAGLLAADQQGGTALVATGVPIRGVAGGVDEARTAYRFTGLNGFLTRATNATSATTNVGLEAWIRTDTTPSATEIIASNGTTSDSWGLAIDSSGHAAGFTQKSTNPGMGFNTLSTTVPVTDGAWHHLVLSRDTSTWKITVDGAASTPSNSTTNPGAPGAGLTIGAWSDGSMAFVGDIDEVSVYAANIGSAAAAHYAAGRHADTVSALTTRTNFDNLGRSIDTWTPDLIRGHAVYDRLGDRTETWTNYQNGVTSSSTGADDVRSTFAYDVVGELLGYCPAKQVYAGGCDPASTSNALAWHYTYDALGRKTIEIAPVNTLATALNTEEVVYDVGGRVAKTCSYPAGGSCTGTTNTHHTNITVYDALGRPLTKVVYDRSTGSDVAKVTTTTTYNLDGAKASVAENGDTLTYFYDLRGRPSQLKRGSTVLTAWAYTPAIGTVASRTDGTMGTTSFGYDWANRETSVTPPASYVSGVISRTYRLDGSLATQAFPNAVTETLAYDAAKRPLSIGMGSTGSLAQTYDRAGRVTSDGRSLTGISGDAGANTQTNSYDGQGRVTGSTGLVAGSTSYTFDLNGNRITKVGAGITTSYSYDRTDELVNQIIGGTQRSFVTDAFGNITSSYDAASALTQTIFDTANRVTTITPSSGSPATFTLDALGRAKARTVGANTDTYGYLGTGTTTYETGAATTDALLDLDGSRLAVKTGGVVSFAIFDLHGSLVGLCPSTGTTITTAYRYDPWGQTIATSGSATNPWRYRGLLDVSPDTTNPLYSMGARLYNPGLGTFTSEDSVAGKAADPLSMNRFLYAEADPTTLIDPDGHTVLYSCTAASDFCLTGYGYVQPSSTGSVMTAVKPLAAKAYAKYYAAKRAETAFCARMRAECMTGGFSTWSANLPALALRDNWEASAPSGAGGRDCGPFSMGCAAQFLAGTAVGVGQSVVDFGIGTVEGTVGLVRDAALCNLGVVSCGSTETAQGIQSAINGVGYGLSHPGDVVLGAANWFGHEHDLLNDPNSFEAGREAGHILGGVEIAGLSINAAGGVVGAEADGAASAVAEEGAAGASPTVEVNGTKYIYGQRVLDRAIQEPGPYHNFPSMFDETILTGNREVISEGYVQYTVPGNINGVNGVYEIGTQPTYFGDGELITHRFFNPGG